METFPSYWVNHLRRTREKCVILGRNEIKTFAHTAGVWFRMLLCNLLKHEYLPIRCHLATQLSSGFISAVILQKKKQFHYNVLYILKSDNNFSHYLKKIKLWQLHSYILPKVLIQLLRVSPEIYFLVFPNVIN